MPRSEHQLTAVDRQHQRRRDQRRQQVVASVPPRAVPMHVAVVPGKHPFEQLLEIGLGARPRLDQC